MTATRTIETEGSAIEFWNAFLFPSSVGDDKMVGFFLPRDTAAKAKKNLANRPNGPGQSSPSTMFGTPVVTPDYATFAAEGAVAPAFVGSSVAEPALLTMGVVSRVPPGNPNPDSNPLFPVGMGNYDGLTGAMIYYTKSGASYFARGQGFDLSASNKTRVIDITSVLNTWLFLALTISATAIQLFDRTRGLSSASLTIIGHTPGGNSIRIGSDWSGAFGGQMDIAAAFVANDILSLAQLDTVKAAIVSIIGTGYNI